jgi:hypothetical protein
MLANAEMSRRCDIRAYLALARRAPSNELSPAQFLAAAFAGKTPQMAVSLFVIALAVVASSALLW